MSKKYMSRPPYCFGDIPDYFMPPMTVEEYKAYEAKYFDFLEPKETKVEQPQQVGAYSRFLKFIGMLKSTTLDADGADVQESPNKSQGGGDKEKTVSKLHESRGSGDDDHKTITDMPEAEMDCKTVTDMVEAEAETNTAGYRLNEESNDQTIDVHAVSSRDSDKEFTSCRLLDESPENDSVINDDEVKPKMSFWKS